MGLVDLIEKLINEHGSADIMEKRLVLFKEQAAAVDARNTALEADNTELRQQLARATDEIGRLRTDLAKHASQALTHEETEILRALASHQHALSAGRLAELTRLSAVRVEYFVTKLEQAEYIYGQHFLGGASAYNLAQQGRAFLIEHGLV